MHNEIPKNQNQDNKRIKQCIQRIFVVDNNESYHGSYAYVYKVPKREMIIFLKIFDDHRDKLKIQKEYKNICKEQLIIVTVINNQHLEKNH